MTKKVRFGLSNVHYAVIGKNAQTQALEYGTPVAWPGARSLSIAEDSELVKVFADNGVWATFDSPKGGTATLSVVDTPDSVYTDLLNFVSLTGGEVVENTTPITKEFAFMFMVEGNDKPRGYKFYRCVLARPGLEAATTEETIEAAEDTYEITFMPIDNGAVKTIKGHQDLASASAISTFFGSVSLPTIPTT